MEQKEIISKSGSCFNGISNDHLHDEAEAALCRSFPPAKYGENEDLAVTMQIIDELRNRANQSERLLNECPQCDNLNYPGKSAAQLKKEIENLLIELITFPVYAESTKADEIMMMVNDLVVTSSLNG